jgi:hypothetical protein
MAGYGKRLLFEPLRFIASADITNAYSLAATMADAAGTIALSHPARLIKVDNFTDQDMKFSFDGVNDHFVLHAGSTMIMDISSNKQADNSFFLGKGEVLYIKYVADPTNGTFVYFSVAYGKGD